MPHQRHSSPILVDFYPVELMDPGFPAAGFVRCTYAGLGGRSDLPRPHIHSLFEVGLVHEGRATFMIADKHLDFVAGDVCVITPSEPHRAFYPVKCICSWMYFDVPRLLAHSAAETSLTGVEPFEGPGFVNVFRGGVYPDLSGTVNGMVREFRERPPYFKDSLRSLLVALLVHLHRLARDGDPHFPRKRAGATIESGLIERISPAITYMHEHFGDRIDMEELSARVFMSPSNFRRIFNRCLGCAPHEYLTSYRVAAAQALLQDGDRAVERIALECGFSDPSSFRRAFRKRTGRAPVSVRVESRKDRKGGKRGIAGD